MLPLLLLLLLLPLLLLLLLMLTRMVLQGLLGGDTPSLCVYMTSIVASVGSLPYAEFSPLYAYRASKAALNTLVRTMGVELAPNNVSTVLIHPGNCTDGASIPANPRQSNSTFSAWT